MGGNSIVKISYFDSAIIAPGVINFTLKFELAADVAHFYTRFTRRFFILPWQNCIFYQTTPTTNCDKTDANIKWIDILAFGWFWYDLYHHFFSHWETGRDWISKTHAWEKVQVCVCMYHPLCKCIFVHCKCIFVHIITGGTGSVVLCVIRYESCFSIAKPMVFIKYTLANLAKKLPIPIRL